MWLVFLLLSTLCLNTLTFASSSSPRSLQAQVLHLDYSNHNIGDDSLVAGFSSPKPLSVSEVCQAIEDKARKNPTAMFSIDLKDNVIADEGAAKLVESLAGLSITELDLSWNRMTNEGIYTLIAGFADKLISSALRLILVGNYGANEENVRKVLSIPSFSDTKKLLTRIIY